MAASKAEYLKRYLSGNEHKKKKIKKKLPTESKPIKRSKIVDDDIDLRMIAQDDENYVEIGEEAPEIIGLIDDRPEEIRRLEELKQGKWKTVGEDEEKLTELVTNKWGVLNPGKSQSPSSFSLKSKKLRSRHDSHVKRDELRTRKANPGLRHDSDDDNSPPRRRATQESDSDQSPPRGTTRHESDSDQSPPRGKVKNEPESDQSPPRRRAANESDTDQSPPRRQNRRDSDSDQSPPRSKPKLDSDQSPPRNSTRNTLESKSSSRSRTDKDVSPPRVQLKSRRTDDEKTSRSGHLIKLEKTLDGKKAGLQSGKALREETEAFRAREKLQFDNMDSSISGRDAKTIVRDRTTGKRRNLEEEAKQKALQDQIKEKREAKYQEWGRGLKQKEMQQSKLEDDIHEMNKPLARYENDADLDKMLKEQERDGDPMLGFIKRKAKAQSLDDRPKYNGPAPPPNRYDILPGYRWDGVDRSNGFEKSRYARLNNKVALRDEAYKWSVEDM